MNISENLESIRDIKHALYINLDIRKDRKEHVEKQLKLIGVKAERFNAIRLPNGAIGCSMSHLKCIEMAKANKWPHLFLVEDDITFTKPSVFTKQLNKFLKNHKDFDMCLLAGNNIPPYEKIDDSCIQVHSCQTTTGYIIQSHYYDILINNYREGIKKLMGDPLNKTLYAIDRYWFHLQQTDKWYLITPLTVIQREDYSDIEQKQTNYSHLLTDMDKEWFFKRQQQMQQLQQLKMMNFSK